MLTTLATSAVDIVIFLLLALSALRLTHAVWIGRPWLGIALAVVGVAAAGWLTIMAAIPLGRWVRVLVVVIIVSAAVHVIVTRAWRVLTREIVVAAALFAAVAVLYLGVFFLWTSPGDAFHLAQNRFVPFLLPDDNEIPHLLAGRLEQGGSTHALIGGWNGSDRPPLQSGLILLGQAPWPPGMISENVSSFAPSVLAQLLWVPAAFAVLRGFGARTRVAVPAVVFAAACSTMLVNSLFTWPKLLSAALLLCAVAVLCDGLRRSRPRPFHFVAAVGAATLALLAHGAAAFAVPFLLVLGILLLRRFGGAWWKPALVGAAVSIGLYLPWALFQRFVDPPGDRLLKLQLAGVTELDGRPFLTALAQSYRALTPAEMVDNKLSNLRTFLTPAVFSGFLNSGHDSPPHNVEEFFYLLPALGVALGVIAALVIVAILSWTGRWRAAHGAGERRRGPIRVPFAPRPRWNTRGALWPLVLVVPCLLFWCLALFGPHATLNHQGSHFWIVLLLIVPFAWLQANAPRLALVALAVQLAITVIYTVPSPTGEPLRPTSLAVAIVGVLAVAACWVWAVRPERSGRRPAGNG